MTLYPAPPPASFRLPATWVPAAIGACFVLSGAAGLIFQLIWARQFAAVFGTAETAVAVVLAAHMAGLALGAAMAANWLPRVARPVLAYGLLEAGIALSALAVGPMLNLAGGLLSAQAGGLAVPPAAEQTGQTFYFVLVALGLLAVPAGLMGATLPLLARGLVVSDASLGPRIASLYAANTAGAVMGALGAGFWLIESFGLTGATLCGAFLNLLAFAGALAAGRNAFSPPLATPETVPAPVPPPPPPPPQPLAGAWARRTDLSFWLPGLLICVSGACSFAYEVVWTRLLSHLFGGTLAAFAAMLAAFLTGIALGAALAAPLARDKARAPHYFAAAQAGIALSAVAALAFLSAAHFPAGGTGAVLTAMLVLLPQACFIGATLPFAIRWRAQSAADGPSVAGFLTALNTLGAITGALAAGFLLLPALGFEGTVRLAVLVNLLLALMAIAVTAQSAAGRGRGAALAALLVLVAMGALYHPARPVAVTRASSVLSDTSGTERYFAVGRSAAVLLRETPAGFILSSNGLPEASIERKGAVPQAHAQRWLTRLPLAARPNARNLLVVGLGGGVLLEDLPASAARADVIELEPRIADANRIIAGERRADPLSDPRVNLIFNDARNALALTAARYDIIVSQPSHPWTAGASHLYTREFLSLAKSRLAPGGVFVQWVNVSFMDAQSLKDVAAGLRVAFTHVRLYQPSPMDLIFLCADDPLTPEENALQAGADDAVALLAILETGNEGVAALAAGGIPVSDDRNSLAVRAVPAGRGLTPDALRGLLEPGDLLAAPGAPWLARAGVNSAALVRRMIHGGAGARALAMIKHHPDQTEAGILAAVGLEAQGESQKAAETAARFALARPDDPRLLWLRVRPYLGALAQDQAPAGAVEAASRLPGSARAVLDGWRRGQKGDWAGLAALDPLLAQSVPTDLWFQAATKLRGDWRLQAALSGRREGLADIGIILDEGLAEGPALDLLMLRLVAARLAEDPARMRESARAALGELARASTSPLRQQRLALIAREMEGLGATGAGLRADAQALLAAGPPAAGAAAQ